jgi:hypothetical protein
VTEVEYREESVTVNYPTEVQTVLAEDEAAIGVLPLADVIRADVGDVIEGLEVPTTSEAELRETVSMLPQEMQVTLDVETTKEVSVQETEVTVAADFVVAEAELSFDEGKLEPVADVDATHAQIEATPSETELLASAVNAVQILAGPVKSEDVQQEVFSVVSQPEQEEQQKDVSVTTRVAKEGKEEWPIEAVSDLRFEEVTEEHGSLVNILPAVESTPVLETDTVVEDAFIPILEQTEREERSSETTVKFEIITTESQEKKTEVTVEERIQPTIPAPEEAVSMEIVSEPAPETTVKLEDATQKFPELEVEDIHREDVSEVELLVQQDNATQSLEQPIVEIATGMEVVVLESETVASLPDEKPDEESVSPAVLPIDEFASATVEAEEKPQMIKEQLEEVAPDVVEPLEQRETEKEELAVALTVPEETEPVTDVVLAPVPEIQTAPEIEIVKEEEVAAVSEEKVQTVIVEQEEEKEKVSVVEEKLVELETVKTAETVKAEETKAVEVETVETVESKAEETVSLTLSQPAVEQPTEVELETVVSLPDEKPDEESVSPAVLPIDEFASATVEAEEKPQMIKEQLEEVAPDVVEPLEQRETEKEELAVALTVPEETEPVTDVVLAPVPEIQTAPEIEIVKEEEVAAVSEEKVQTVIVEQEEEKEKVSVVEEKLVELETVKTAETVKEEETKAVEVETVETVESKAEETVSLTLSQPAVEQPTEVELETVVSLPDEKPDEESVSPAVLPIDEFASATVEAEEKPQMIKEQLEEVAPDVVEPLEQRETEKEELAVALTVPEETEPVTDVVLAPVPEIQTAPEIEIVKEEEVAAVSEEKVQTVIVEQEEEKEKVSVVEEKLVELETVKTAETVKEEETKAVEVETVETVESKAEETVNLTLSQPAVEQPTEVELETVVSLPDEKPDEESVSPAVLPIDEFASATVEAEEKPQMIKEQLEEVAPDVVEPLEQRETEKEELAVALTVPEETEPVTDVVLAPVPEIQTAPEIEIVKEEEVAAVSEEKVQTVIVEQEEEKEKVSVVEEKLVELETVKTAETVKEEETKAVEVETVETVESKAEETVSLTLSQPAVEQPTEVELETVVSLPDEKPDEESVSPAVLPIDEFASATVEAEEKPQMIKEQLEEVAPDVVEPLEQRETEKEELAVALTVPEETEPVTDVVLAPVPEIQTAPEIEIVKEEEVAAVSEEKVQTVIVEQEEEKEKVSVVEEKLVELETVKTAETVKEEETKAVEVETVETVESKAEETVNLILSQPSTEVAERDEIDSVLNVPEQQKSTQESTAATVYREVELKEAPSTLLADGMRPTKLAEPA